MEIPGRASHNHEGAKENWEVGGGKEVMNVKELAQYLGQSVPGVWLKAGGKDFPRSYPGLTKAPSHRYWYKDEIDRWLDALPERERAQIEVNRACAREQSPYPSVNDVQRWLTGTPSPEQARLLATFPPEEAREMQRRRRAQELKDRSRRERELPDRLSKALRSTPN